MKAGKKLLVLLMMFTMLLGCPIQVNAMMDNDNTCAPDSVGLIINHSYSISSGNKRIYINANVTASDIMAEIGFKNIKVQQSSNGTSGWTTYFAPSNQVITDAKKHSLEDFLISVPGGYYYRFELTNYAKEYGWFFPDSQSITVTSNAVYVST